MHVKRYLGKRAAVITMTAIVGLGLSACAIPNTSSAGPSDPLAADLFRAVNADRAANGLPAFSWSPKLANSAGSWSHQMSNAGSLYHQNLSALISSPAYAGYFTLGENILVGPGGMSAGQIEGSWRASAPHWANILNRSFNVIGIGYYRGPDGKIWAAQEFGGI